MKKALITGVSGQDGSYLAEFLLEQGYEVYGLIRRVALEDREHRMWRLKHILKDIQLVPGSLESFPSVYNAFNKTKPDECYHLAAQSFVSYSFEDEFSTLNTNINGTHHVLAALKEIAPQCKIYFAGSSEMFGKVKEMPQSEDTPFHPRSPYGISKVAGFELTRNYREAYNIFAACGILFNHESPRRGYEFVTRKITSGVARIKLGLSNELRLGNLDAKRDWGHAKEYIKAMWLMLQQDTPDDFVIGTGKAFTVKDFCEAAFSHVGLNYQDYVVTDPLFYRPAEVEILLSNSNKAKAKLGWQNSIEFKDLVVEMVENDIAILTNKKRP